MPLYIEKEKEKKEGLGSGINVIAGGAAKIPALFSRVGAQGFGSLAGEGIALAGKALTDDDEFWNKLYNRTHGSFKQTVGDYYHGTGKVDVANDPMSILVEPTMGGIRGGFDSMNRLGIYWDEIFNKYFSTPGGSLPPAPK